MSADAGHQPRADPGTESTGAKKAFDLGVNYAEISVSNLAPSAVSSLTSESIEDGVSFSWAKTQ